MPWFIYSGFDSKGHAVSGEEFGDNQAEVMSRLMTGGVSVLEIRTKKGEGIFDAIGKRFQWVSTHELKFLYVNLATLIEAGCTLRASLASLGDQSENPMLKKALTDINAAIASGKSFSESLQAHPSIFSPLFVSLVKAGEEGGMLDKILLRYAVFTENQEAIKGRIRGALVLPAIMILVAVGVVVGLLTYVFPTFMELFKGRESMLPTPTKIVMAVSDFLRYQYLTLIGLGILGVVGLWLFLKWEKGWRAFSWFQLRVPLFGTLFRKAYVARFAHTLGSLVKGGVPALRALRITSETIPNTEVKDIIASIQESVERGGTFSAPMQKHKHLFPAMVTLMISVGESTGKIDHMLDKVGEYYDQEVSEAISTILTAIEPLLTVVMGTVVLTIAASMFLPLFNISKVLR